MSTVNNLLYFFERPSQPIFRPKGQDGNISYDVPPDYFTERYKPIAAQVQTRGSTSIPVKTITPPDITLPASLDKRTNFSVFNSFHMECATSLINTLMGIRSTEDFLSACVYIQQRVNPYLFIYALSTAVLHRNDTRNLSLPSHFCTFPELYIDGQALQQLRAEGTVVPTADARIPVEIPRDFTASDLDVEHRLAYFREDIGVNLHHWHWHLIYPSSGPMDIVNKDRRGELFYYMHQQLLARYNFERFTNDLGRVANFGDYRSPIPEAYFPKLDTQLASRVWAPRQANTTLQDVFRDYDQIYATVDDLERWRDRIYEAIHRGSYYRGDTLVPFTEAEGINVLGEMIDSSILSPNRQLYGNLHNQGHNMISFIHDPDSRFLEGMGVMGENTTSFRDPVFFRWHTSIQEMFDTYKQTLPPYTVQQLSFDGVSVTSADVISEGVQARQANNIFHTLWERNQVNLTSGVDFVPRGSVFAAFTHLQHRPFTFRIIVQNSGAQRVGTVRIFLGPRNDERGTPFRFREHRLFFFELDRFTTTLRAGSNTIERRSSESTLTTPFEVTFRSLYSSASTGTNAAENFNFCGCGWPDHFIIPRGTPEGFPATLFVMVTNYQDDRVENSTMDSASTGCDNAFMYCGVRNRRYPDRRAMGFPFDRLGRAGVGVLSQFLTPNMRTTNVQVKNTNIIQNGPTFNNTSTNASAPARATMTTRTATTTPKKS